MFALGVGACGVRTVAVGATSTSGRAVAHRIPSSRARPVSPVVADARISLAPLRATPTPTRLTGGWCSPSAPSRGGWAVTRARAGRSSGGAGSSNEPDNEPEHNEREILNNVQPSKPSEKKNNGGSSTSNNDSSRSNGFHFSSNPFSNAQPPRQQKQHQQQQQQQQQQAGLKKPFSTGPKKSKTDSQPSSPSTRL